MEQVFTKMASASLSLSVSVYPSISMMEATTSVSATFIWQPYVSINSFLSLIISLFIALLIINCDLYKIGKVKIIIIHGEKLHNNLSCAIFVTRKNKKFFHS